MLMMFYLNVFYLPTLKDVVGYYKLQNEVMFWFTLNRRTATWNLFVNYIILTHQYCKTESLNPNHKNLTLFREILAFSGVLNLAPALAATSKGSEYSSSSLELEHGLSVSIR